MYAHNFTNRYGSPCWTNFYQNITSGRGYHGGERHINAQVSLRRKELDTYYPAVHPGVFFIIRPHVEYGLGLWTSRARGGIFVCKYVPLRCRCKAKRRSSLFAIPVRRTQSPIGEWYAKWVVSVECPRADDNAQQRYR